MLHLAIGRVWLDLEELEEASPVCTLYDRLEALRKDWSCKNEVLSQALAIALVAAGAYLVAPLLESLHGKEVLEKWHFADYHEVDTILNVLLL